MKNIIVLGSINTEDLINVGKILMSKVSVEKYNAKIPINKKALPNKVYKRNFIAEYSLRPAPQIEIKKNIGISSSSQNRKNIMRSKEQKTPKTALWSTRSHVKYSETLDEIDHEDKTATNIRVEQSKTNGRLKPSIPTRYWTLKELTEIQLLIESMSWNFCEESLSNEEKMNKEIINSMVTIDRAKYLTIFSLRIIEEMMIAPIKGKNINKVKMPDPLKSN